MDREYVVGIDIETATAYLSFTGVTENDEGTYICKITTQLGAAESTFTLVVNPPSMYLLCTYINIHICMLLACMV